MLEKQFIFAISLMFLFHSQPNLNFVDNKDHGVRKPQGVLLRKKVPSGHWLMPHNTVEFFRFELKSNLSDQPKTKVTTGLTLYYLPVVKGH